jgi:hypothetical protein
MTVGDILLSKFGLAIKEYGEAVLQQPWTLKVKNHSIDVIESEVTNFQLMVENGVIQRDKNIDPILEQFKESNREFFEWFSTVLHKKYPQFTLLLRFDEQKQLILNEHSHIYGRIHLDQNKLFWENLCDLQKNYPELFKQVDCVLDFIITKGQVTSLDFKYYFIEDFLLKRNPYTVIDTKILNRNLSWVNIIEMKLSSMPNYYGKLTLYRNEDGLIVRSEDHRKLRF